MSTKGLPPAYLGPFKLEGLEWMKLPDGHVLDGVSGATHSLAVARMAHARLKQLGFIFVEPSVYGTTNRVFEFHYVRTDHPVDGLTTRSRWVSIVLVAINPAQIPRYEVVLKDPPHDRQGLTFGSQELAAKKQSFPTGGYWIRPTLDD